MLRTFFSVVGLAPVSELYLSTLVSTLTGVGLRTPSLDYSGGFLSFDETSERRLKGDIFCSGCLTMVGERKLAQLLGLLHETLDLPGHFVQLGTWRGGVGILVRAFYHVYGEPRLVWLCDSYDGLPALFDSEQKFADDFLRVSLDEVQDNFRTFGLLDNQVRFVTGFFNESLPGSQR